MKVLFRACLLMFAVFLFAGCGGGSSDGGPTLIPGNGNNDGGGNGDGSSDPNTVRFGSFTGDAFTVGSMATNQTDLDAGESATLSVSLIDQVGNPIATQAASPDGTITVQFSSNCIVSGQAEVSPSIATINTNGSTSVTYTARGCEGVDTITALTSVDLTSYTAKAGITTVSSPLGSIGFTAATPSVIGLKGSGAIPEQSKVSFLVSNSTGGPVPNQEVSFSLDNTAGGITISNETGLTDANGIASTTVASGTVATAVRVTATAAQSSALVVSTGIADNDSFSLSATTLNIEGFEYDGTKTTLTIRAADRYNNPVPDGTAVSFQAEGAAVDGSCLTVSGACSVTLSSQNPRPADGRVTVLATAVGEESFIDSETSNGQFDDAELPFLQDLDEAFRDDNENGVRDSNEPYVNFNENPEATGGFDLKNGKFDGLLCKGPNLCSPSSTITLRESIVIVLSGSGLIVNIQPVTIDIYNKVETVIVSVSDQRGQVPPAGTTISASTTIGNLQGTTSYTQISTNLSGPAIYAFRIGRGAADGEGTFTVTVTTPLGIISKDLSNVVQH